MEKKGKHQEQELNINIFPGIALVFKGYIGFKGCSLCFKTYSSNHIHLPQTFPYLL